MLGACAFLFVIIAAEIYIIGGDASAQDAGSPLAEASSSQTASPATLQIPPVITYREFVERPLFSDSRRPPQEAATATESVRSVQLTNNWKVTGIVLAGEDSFAHVQGVRDQKTVRLQTGMPLEGWNLTEISHDYVEFRSSGESVTMSLHSKQDNKALRRR
jgi:hypothetical protein